MVSRKSSTLALCAWCLLGSTAAVHADEVSATADKSKKAPIVTDPTPATKTAKEVVKEVSKEADAKNPTIVTDETPGGKAEPPQEKPAIPVDPNVKVEQTGPSEKPTSTSDPLKKPETAASVMPSDPMALLYAEKVAPGPFEAKRQLLLSSIKVAKKQNFGITSYLNELNKIEEQIKQGNATPQLEARIDSIADGLTDQLKRSQILKSQRPAAGSTRTSYTAGGGSADAGHGHKNTDAIINELRQKYGDKIPSGLDNAELKEKLMKSDLAREYLKKFTNGN